MLDQLTQLAQQFGNETVVNNTAIPNEHNEGVIKETSSSIFSGLQKIVAEGGIEQLASLFQGNNAQQNTNPAVTKLTEQLTENLGQKFGLNSETSSNVAGSMITQVLGSLVNKIKDPNDKNFQIGDLIGALTGGGKNSEIMDTISKYGTQFGLDQNADGKLDVQDVLVVTKGRDGILGFIGKIFRK